MPICHTYGKDQMLAVKSSAAQRGRPGRPRKGASALIDGRILDAAWALFSEQGYRDTSMEGIAERAGVTRATLYQRHADKISLFRASLTSRGEAWGEVYNGMDWLVGDSLEERLKNYARQVLTFSQNSIVSASRRLSNGIRGEAAPVAHGLDKAFRRRMNQLLAADLAEHARREGQELSDPAEIAMLVTGLLETIIGQSEREGHDLDWMIQHGVRAMRLLLDGRSGW